MHRTSKQATGTASGKIILMGEHAVVYGEPAVAIPFPAASVRATVTESVGPVELDCVFHRGLLSEIPERLSSLSAAITATTLELEEELSDFIIHIESTVPPERGMGSSAAVAVAIIRALYHYFDKPLPREKLLELAAVSESIAHGNPSGLDAAMTSGDSPLFFTKGQPFEAFPLKLNACLIVADTGMPGSTKEAVESVATLLKTNPKKNGQLIRTLGELAKQARVAIESNHPVKLGEHMSRAHENLTALGVSNNQLNALVQTAQESGALGAKLTGGGRGGCIIALAADQTVANQVSTALLDAGAVKTWIYQMGG